MGKDDPEVLGLSKWNWPELNYQIVYKAMRFAEVTNR